MTTILLQAVTVTAVVLLAVAVWTIVVVSRVSRAPRARLTALQQALAAVAGGSRTVGATPDGGIVATRRVSTEDEHFELRHINADQLARYDQALRTGDALTIHAHCFHVLSRLTARQRITLHVPACLSAARPVVEQRDVGPWAMLGALGGIVLGSLLATADELDGLLHAMTEGLLAADDGPFPFPLHSDTSHHDHHQGPSRK